MALRLVIAIALVVTTTGCTSSEPPEASAPTESPSSAPSSATAEDGTDAPEQGFAGAWLDVTDRALGVTGDWTNKVEVADLDRDGDVDLLFANGGDYESPGTPVASRVFLNSGDGTFADATNRCSGRPWPSRAS